MVHMCAFNYRFVPAVRRAREMLEAGDLGEVHHFRGVYRQSWGADPARRGLWRFDPALAGGGALGDLASHVMDMARYLVGEIESVASQVATFVPGREVDDAVAARCRSQAARSARSRPRASPRANLNRFTWEINGSEGSLAFDLERLNELVVDGKRTLVNPDGWWPPGHVLGWEHTFVFELRRFLDAVAGRGTWRLTGRPSRTGARRRGVRRDPRVRARGPARPSRGLSGAQTATARPLSAASYSAAIIRACATASSRPKGCSVSLAHARAKSTSSQP